MNGPDPTTSQPVNALAVTARARPGLTRHLAGVFALFLGLYIATASGHLSTPDEEIMFRMAEGLATRGSLAIEPIVDGAGGTFASRRGRDGREYAQYGVGNALLAVPLYAVGAVVARMVEPETAVRWLDFNSGALVPDSEASPAALRGPALVRRFAVSFQGCLLGAALAALVWRLAFRLAGGDDAMSSGADVARRRAIRAAWLTAVAAGAGTMMWTHARTFFSEPPTALFLLGAFLAATGGRAGTPPSHRRAFAAGAMLAGALATRLDSLVFLPAVALTLTLRFLETAPAGISIAATGPVRRLRFDFSAARATLVSPAFLRVVVATAFPVVVFALWQASFNFRHFGAVTATAYSDQREGFHFSAPMLAGLYGFLFSAGRGIAFFSPGIVFGLLGWGALRRSRPAAAWGLAAAALCKLLVQSKWQNWSGGWDWGPRHVYVVAPLVTVCAAAGFAARPWGWRRTAAFAAVMIPAAGVQLYGTSQHPVDFHMIYYRAPMASATMRPPLAFALYQPEQTAARADALRKAAPEMDPADQKDLFRRLSLAPLTDTVYIPQNSVWYRYAEMWSLGYTDNLWLRLAARARGTEKSIP